MGGAFLVVLGLSLLRYRAAVATGIAGAIFKLPDVITDRRPPRHDMKDSLAFRARVIRFVLVPWAAGVTVMGLLFLLGLSHPA